MSYQNSRQTLLTNTNRESRTIKMSLPYYPKNLDDSSSNNTKYNQNRHQFYNEATHFSLFFLSS